MYQLKNLDGVIVDTYPTAAAAVEAADRHPYAGDVVDRDGTVVSSRRERTIAALRRIASDARPVPPRPSASPTCRAAWDHFHRATQAARGLR